MIKKKKKTSLPQVKGAGSVAFSGANSTDFVHEALADPSHPLLDIRSLLSCHQHRDCD